MEFSNEVCVVNVCGTVAFRLGESFSNLKLKTAFKLHDDKCINQWMPLVQLETKLMFLIRSMPFEK
jgi:hypothetical protein